MKMNVVLAALCGLALACNPKQADPELTCGAGTTREGDACVSTTPTVECAPGTRLEGGRCVSTVVEVHCAEGTRLEDGACVADGPTCGEGTELRDGVCVVVPPPEPTSTWGSDVRICGRSQTCSHPQLALGPDGALYVAYMNTSGASYAVVVSVSLDDGQTFTEKQRITSTDGYAMQPRVAVTSGGTVALAWTNYRPSDDGESYGNSDILVTTSADHGETWSAPTSVSGPPDELLHYEPALAADGDGFSVVWDSYLGNTSTALAVFSHDSGATFSMPLVVPTTTDPYDSVSGGGPLSRTADGAYLRPTVRVGYDFTTGDYRYDLGLQGLSRAADDSLTSDLEVDLTRMFSMSDFRLSPALSLAASASQRCLAFSNASSRDVDIFVAQWPASDEVPPAAKAIPGGTGTMQLAPRAALDDAGRCHVTWFDNRSGRWALMSAIVDADGGAHTPEQVSDATFAEDGVDAQLDTVDDLVVGAQYRFATWVDLRDGAGNVYVSRSPLSP